MNKLIVIIGPARAGKTTFAKWLAQCKGEKTSGTSAVVYELMAKARGCPLEELYKVPKELLRPHLITFADALCDIYPDILSQGLIQEGVTIIDGIRRRAEFEELDKKYNLTVYFVKRDIGTVKDNFELTEDDADFIVDNNYEINQFKILPNPINRIFT